MVALMSVLALVVCVFAVIDGGSWGEDRSSVLLNGAKGGQAADIVPKAAIARLAKKQALVGSGDFSIGMNVGTHVKGQGYFDAEHKDDKFVQVGEIVSELEKRRAENAATNQERRASGLYSNWDDFVSESEDDGSGSFVTANEKVRHFVSLPSSFAPNCPPSQ